MGLETSQCGVSTRIVNFTIEGKGDEWKLHWKWLKSMIALLSIILFIKNYILFFKGGLQVV